MNSEMAYFYQDKVKVLHKKGYTPTGMVWNTDIAAVSLIFLEQQYGGRDAL